jgi:hypothetical protein
MSTTTFRWAATPARLAALCPAIVPCFEQAGGTGPTLTGVLLCLAGLGALGGLALTAILLLIRHEGRQHGPLPVALIEPVTARLPQGVTRRSGTGPLPVVLDGPPAPGK